MKPLYLFLALGLLACNQNQNNAASESDPGLNTRDTASVAEQTESSPARTDTYSNERFRDVRVEEVGDSTYRVQGKAQVFEAAFSWVVEDGHNELESGHVTTDAGAPAWGNFSFAMEVQKQRPNSTLMLILFESSAKDGSRQYELPVKLK